MKIGELGSIAGTSLSNATAGVGYYSTPDQLDGLSNLAETSAVLGVGGLGQAIAVPNQNSTMRAIVAANSEMRTAVKKANAAKVSAAKQNPITASKLVAAANRKSNPATNVQSQIIGAMSKAAAEAQKALVRKSQAATALKAGDKQKAAAATISYMQHNRAASTLAMRAEKTRVALASDRLAATLEEQAKFIEAGAKKIMAASGRTPQTDRMMAQVAQLRARAKRLRANSAAVAKLPDTPTAAPNQKTVAALANKYNIRTAMQGRMDDRRAVISVLSDISDNAMAQVTDYEGAVEYYGNNLAGRMMADVEYGNVASFLQGLAMMDAFGQVPADVAARAAAAEKDMQAAGNQQAQQSGGGGNFFSQLVGGIQSGAKLLSDTTKGVSTALNAAQKVSSEVQEAGKALGIKPPASTKPPAIATKLPAAPAAPAKVAAPVRTPPAQVKAAQAASRVTVSEQKVAAPQPQAPAAAAGGSKAMMYGGIAAVVAVAAFVGYKALRA